VKNLLSKANCDRLGLGKLRRVFRTAYLHTFGHFPHYEFKHIQNLTSVLLLTTSTETQQLLQDFTLPEELQSFANLS